MDKEQKDVQDAKKLLRKYWQEKNYAGLWRIALDVVKNLWHHYAGIDSKRRSKQWIFWCILSISLILGALTGKLQGSAWLPAALVTAYAVYIYKGGRYVLKPKGLGYLLYLAPIAIIMSMMNSGGTKQPRSPAVDNNDSSSYSNSTNSDDSDTVTDSPSMDFEFSSTEVAEANIIYESKIDGSSIKFYNAAFLDNAGFELAYFDALAKGIEQFMRSKKISTDAIRIDRNSITIHPNDNTQKNNLRMAILIGDDLKNAFVVHADPVGDTHVNMKFYKANSSELVDNLGEIKP